MTRQRYTKISKYPQHRPAFLYLLAKKSGQECRVFPSGGQHCHEPKQVEGNLFALTKINARTENTSTCKYYEYSSVFFLGVIELFCIFALLTTGINHYNKSAKNEVQHGRA